MSSDSELTEFEDEEEVPLSASTRSKASKGKTKANGEPEGYRIRGALKVPRATTYTCQSLYGAHISTLGHVAQLERVNRADTLAGC